MDVLAAAKALNQKAAQQKWHHFCDPGLQFSEPAYGKLLEIWREKSGERAMPHRSQITPRDLKDLLRNILIFERIEKNPSRFRWRLVGTSITEITGYNMTGKTIDESVPSEHLPRWIECGDLILDGGKPLRFLGRVHISGREYLDAENLFVPLANDNDEPTFIMGLCRYTPRRSDETDSWENQIASIPGGLL